MPYGITQRYLPPGRADIPTHLPYSIKQPRITGLWFLVLLLTFLFMVLCAK